MGETKNTTPKLYGTVLFVFSFLSAANVRGSVAGSVGNLQGIGYSGLIYLKDP